MPKTITVTLTVRTFRDAINGAIRHGSLTDYRLAIQPHGRKPGVWLKSSDTIHVDCPGATLRFEVEGRGADYQPAGIALAQLLETGSPAVRLRGSAKHVKGSPFKVLQLQGGILDLEDAVPRPPAGTPRSLKRYKFTLLIQRLSDGAIGIIDPYLENEN